MKTDQEIADHLSLKMQKEIIRMIKTNPLIPWNGGPFAKPIQDAWEKYKNDHPVK